MYLAVEDVVWSVLLKLEVPDQHNSIRVVGDVGISEVADQQQLWVLEGLFPVMRGREIIAHIA